MAREEFRHTSAQTSLSTFQYSQQETPLESSQLPDSYIYIYIYICIKQEIALKCIFKSELLCAKACDDANSYIHLTLYTNIHTYAYMYVYILGFILIRWISDLTTAFAIPYATNSNAISSDISSDTAELVVNAAHSDFSTILLFFICEL